MSFSLRSDSFEASGEIPRKFTCEGDDTSVHLSWSGAPEATKSFALIVDDPDAPDPDAPQMVYVHWVLYNIPADADELTEDINTEELPNGTQQGLNDWKRTGYGGPCPPIGRHRYFHKIYALDCVLPDLASPSKPQLLEAIQGHVLAQAELMGTYKKQG